MRDKQFNKVLLLKYFSIETNNILKFKILKNIINGNVKTDKLLTIRVFIKKN